MASKGTILLTGASGFVGGHIIREALARGFSVRAVVRSDASGKKTVAQFPQATDKLSYVVVPDILAVDDYADKLDDVSAIIHTASPFILTPQDNVKDLLEPAVKGAVAVLEAGKRFGTPALRRVVFTSSFAAIGDFLGGYFPGREFSEADWNTISYEDASTARGDVAYCASKAFAERAMWDWFRENKGVGFDMAAINPPWVFGPYVADPADLKHLGESVGAAYGLFGADKVPDPDFCGCADVRDVAAAHLAAVETPAAGGQRFLVGRDFNWQRAVDAAREAMPELRGRLPEGTPGRWPETYTVNGGKAARVLGIEYRTIGQTFADMYAQLLRVEKAQSA